MKNDHDMTGCSDDKTPTAGLESQFANEIQHGAMASAQRVLVIDDDPVIGRMIEKTLEGESRVLQEFGLPEADAYDFYDVDCIVLDYQMPVRDGLEVLKEIRSVRDDVPVLFLTGFGSTEIAEKAISLGANRFVAKPISPVAIRAMIRELTSGAKHNAELSLDRRRGVDGPRNKVPEFSRQFFAVKSDQSLVEGVVARFGTRSAFVEVPAALELGVGERVSGISFQFGRIQVDSGQGIVCGVEELSLEVNEVEFLVPELWGVVEKSPAGRTAGDGGGSGKDSSPDNLAWLKEEQTKLPGDFRIAVHELVGVLQVVEQDAAAFEANAKGVSGSVQDLRSETEFVTSVSAKYSPLFWRAMKNFEASARSLLRGELSVLAKEYARKHLFPFALSSPFLARVVEKPIGVPGDYGMLGQILGNPLEGYSAYGRIFNSWILECGAASAYRNRVGLLHREIESAVRKAGNDGRKAEILSMASGVAYEVQRYIESPVEEQAADFVLVDFSPETLEEARRQYRTLGVFPEGVKVELHQSSVIDLANATRQVSGEGYKPESKYDLVYCAGLFDYLSDRLVARVTAYLFGLLRPGGKLVVSNYTVENPIIAWMTMVMDWELIYRSKEDFGKLIKSALPEQSVELETDSDGVEVYALITN